MIKGEGIMTRESKKGGERKLEKLILSRSLNRCSKYNVQCVRHKKWNCTKKRVNLFTAI